MGDKVTCLFSEAINFVAPVKFFKPTTKINFRYSSKE